MKTTKSILLLFGIFISLNCFPQWRPSHNPATNYTVNGTASYNNAAYTIQLSNGGPGTLWHKDVKSFLNPFTICFDFQVTGGDPGIDEFENDGFTFMFGLLDDAEGATITHTGTGATGGGFGSLGSGKPYFGTRINLFFEFDMSSNRATCSDPNDSNIHEHLSLNPDVAGDHMSIPSECFIGICGIMNPVPMKGTGAYNGASTGCPHSPSAFDGSIPNTVRDGAVYSVAISFNPNGSGGGTFRLILNHVTKVNQTIANLANYYNPAGINNAQKKFMFGFGSDNSQITVPSRENIIISNLGYTCPMLPVSLINFDVKSNVNSALLTWSTAKEINNSYFDVQHSKDGLQFESIGKVTGAGNSNSIRNYQFVHNNPDIGVNYYRLAQYDTDGKSEYSEVRVLELIDSHINIAPMPFQNETILNFDKNTNAQVSILDITGKVIAEKQAVETQKLKIGGELPSGSYILQVLEENESPQFFMIIKE